MYTHYGPMMSYYSAKTRAYLSYKRIPFIEQYEIETYQDRVVPVVGYTVLPVLEADDGEIMQDTTVIIDMLEQRHPERPAFPNDPVLMLATRIVEFFIDEFWIATAMHTRWNNADSRRFATAEFNQFFGRGEDARATAQEWSNGDALAERMQGHLPSLGIDSESGRQVIQRVFEEATQLLNLAVGPRQFAFGSRASLVDCCLFEGYFAHQYRDHGPAQQYLKSKASALSYFLDNMQAANGAPASGDLVLTDEFRNYLSYIGPIGAAYAASVTELAQPIVAAASEGEALNARLTPEIKLLGHPYKRNCGVFTAWKVQRVRDVYMDLSGHDKERADELTTQIGWSSVLDEPQSEGSSIARIERVGFRLHALHGQN
ncbi:MAG: glutathione S-transferase N-terminal domain-containing protein [Pseudomonadales bacterium]